jgi:hypothetical protein
MRVRRQAPSILLLKNFVLPCVYFILIFGTLNSHSLQRHSCFLMPSSIFLFCCSRGAHSSIGIRHRCPRLFLLLFLISVFLLFTVFVLVCPGADKLNNCTFWYGTGPVRDDSSSASTLQSPIVAADPLCQKQPRL